MRILRQLLAVSLSYLLVFPAFAKSNAIGQAVYTESAMLRDALLESGSTLFNNDIVSVPSKGIARIAFAGGSQVEVLEGSSVRFARSESAAQFFVENGSASFRSEPGSAVETTIADATIRPAQGLAASGLIQMASPDLAIVVARKGTLEITTQHDAKTLLVAEGSAAQISLVPEPDPQQGGAVPAGRRSPLAGISQKKLAIIALLAGGAVVVTGVILATRKKISDEQVTNEVTPFTVNH